MPKPASGAGEKWKRCVRRTAVVLLALILLTAAGCAAILFHIYHAPYPKTENSFFSSAFVSDRTVLVIVPHQDDEINLGYGVIDAFTEAGGSVYVLFTTNSDRSDNAQLRTEEAVLCCGLMHVPKANIILLGYGDHINNPCFYLGGENEVRTSEGGYSKTYGAFGITDFHTLRYGEAADYTWGNMKNDLKQVVLDIRPDVIFAVDTDDHSDHAAASQLFDLAMGEILREQPLYKPLVYKGFAYPYAWYGNADFSGLPLKSAAPQWVSSAYETAYSWNERVRFPMHPAYLGYTLRSSKLRSLLLMHKSQAAIFHETRLLNSDKVFWERRTDALLANVYASSGNAALLSDFVIAGTREQPERNAWFPDTDDERPELRFRWNEPQTISEIVFYTAPEPAGRVLTVEVSVPDTGETVSYTLADHSGKPCRMAFERENIRAVDIRITGRQGEAGLMEIEFLPPRDMPLQWMSVTTESGDFCTELRSPSMQALTLRLYGYPKAPETAAAVVLKDGRKAAQAEYRNGTLAVPPLPNGTYRLTVACGACKAEVVLRIGSAMIIERGIQWIERRLDAILP